MSSQMVFRPVEGAILDLESLQAVSDAEDRVLSAWMQSIWPGTGAVILDGFELVGDPAPLGPPGTVRPDSKSEFAVVTPGTALVSDRDGRRYLIKIEEELQARWPTQAGSAVRGVLALVPKVEPPERSVVSVARLNVSAQLGFVKPNQADQPNLLPIASAVGNGRDWLNDLRRVMQPEHPAVQALLKQLEALETTVWRAEPEGGVWDRQVLGRNWVRYQTVAAAAIQAGRMVLTSRSMTTLDRIRTLTSLHDQLKRSVERAANELLQSFGPAEGAGPYSALMGGAGDGEGAK